MKRLFYIGYPLYSSSELNGTNSTNVIRSLNLIFRLGVCQILNIFAFQFDMKWSVVSVKLLNQKHTFLEFRRCILLLWANRRSFRWVTLIVRNLYNELSGRCIKWTFRFDTIFRLVILYARDKYKSAVRSINYLIKLS